jgi:hypothetical protein
MYNLQIKYPKNCKSIYKKNFLFYIVIIDNYEHENLKPF